MSNTQEIWHRPPRHVIKEIRQKEIAERKAKRDKMTIEEKIAHLDKVLGPNIGAQKERAKLKAKLEARYQEPKKEKASKPKQEKTKIHKQT